MTPFTRQHFNIVARTLRAATPRKSHQAEMFQWEGTVLRFADVFSELNDNFDEKRFLIACGYSGFRLSILSQEASA